MGGIRLTIPNFLVIGAQKAGTTWLSQVLPQHPDIFMPAQEVRYFNDHYGKGHDWYLSWYNGRKNERAVGEKTPGYLWVPSPFQTEFPANKRRDIPQLVQAYNPEMRLIVTLRDPVRRAISAFFHHMREGRIDLQERIRDVGMRYGIIDRGFYHHQLTQWLEYFPRDQMLILTMETDIEVNAAATARRLYEFLDVSPDFKPSLLDRRSNRRWSPFALYVGRHSRLLGRVVNRLPVLSTLPYPHIRVTAEDIEFLAELYEESNKRLQDLLQVDLSMWTQPSTPGSLG